MAKKYPEVDESIRKAHLMGDIETTSYMLCRTVHTASTSAVHGKELHINAKRASNLRSSAAVYPCAQSTDSEHCSGAYGMGDVWESNRTIDSQPDAEPSGIPWPNTKSSLRTTISIQPYSNDPASRVELPPTKDIVPHTQESSISHVHGQAGGGQGISIALQRYLLEPARDGGPTYSLLWGAAW